MDVLARPYVAVVGEIELGRGHMYGTGMVTLFGEVTRVRHDPELLAIVDHIRLAEAFEDAGTDIIQYGWCRGGVQYPRGQDKNGTYQRCVWIAVMRALERMIANVTEFKSYLAATENALLVHFGQTEMGMVFAANDFYEGTDEEGKEWAVGQLAEIATKLRGADALMLVAGPDIDSTR